LEAKPFQISHDHNLQEQTMNTKHVSIHVRALILTAALGAVAVGYTATSAAQDSANVRSEKVSYADLNLSNPAGAATLYRRIVSAAHNVCDEGDETLAMRASARTCRDKAIAEAVMTVGHPELIAVYDSKNHQPLPITLAAVQRR
jgi:UrcA family protein